MSNRHHFMQPVTASLLLATLLLSGLPAALATAGQDYRFRVLLDGDEIGSHRFRISRAGDRELVEIDAEFKVKFIGITFYSYVHDNREQWRGGCLEEIASITDDNGDKFKVDGRARGENFEVSTLDGQQRLDAGCVMTFAYWNRDYLRQSRLLNSQNGEYLEVDVEFGGVERLRFDQREVAAQRYRLRNRERDVDITVWYGESSGEWIGLESRVGKRVIRYLPEDVARMVRLDQPAATNDLGRATTKK